MSEREQAIEKVEEVLYDWHRIAKKRGSLALPSRRRTLAVLIVDLASQPVVERQVTDEMVACAAGVVSDYVGTRVDVDAWSVARAALEAALGASSKP